MAKRAKSFRALSVAAILFLTLLAAPMLANGIEHSFDVKAGGRIRIVAQGASIEVDTRPGNRAYINISRGGDSESRILRDYDIEVYQNDGEIVVDISIVVPKRFDVDLTTSGGSIQIADLEGSVDVRSSGGSLRLQAIDGPINARTSGGSITVKECTGTTHVRTSGGSIRIDNAKGAINAHTSGGSVKAFLSAQPGGNSRLTTSGGSVTVYLDEGAEVLGEIRNAEVVRQ